MEKPMLGQVQSNEIKGCVVLMSLVEKIHGLESVSIHIGMEF